MAEQVPGPSHHSFSRLMHRLDRLSVQKPDFLKTSQERHLQERCAGIGTFIEYWWMDRSAAAQQIRDAVDYYQKYGPEDPTAKERYQNMLVGYLFVVNRSLFMAEKRTMDHFDKSKEKRQIEGVLRAINGDHLHVGTGEGKSSVIIPIAGIVEAMTSPKEKVVLSSSNGVLLKELKDNTTKFTQKLDASGLFDKKPIECKDAQIETSSEDREKPLPERMVREALCDGQFSEASKKEWVKGQWKGYGDPDEGKGYLDNNLGSSPQIYFATEKDLVFTYLKEKHKFKACPRIFMDEADVAYNRNTPYISSMQEFTASPDEILNSAADWLMNRMIAKQIKRADIIADAGGFRLTDTARERIAYNTKTGLDFARVERRLNAGYVKPGSWEDTFLSSVDELSSQAGLVFTNEEQKHDFRVRMWNIMSALHEPEKGKKGDFSAIVQFMGDKVVSMKMALEKGFTVAPSGKLIVRDAYVDELLHSHQYNKDTQIAALAAAGRYQFVGRGATFASTHFQSFVHDLSEKLTLMSGTLMYPDALKGKIKEGSFASFIKKETGREVILMTPPEIKRVPRPCVAKHIGEARKNLIAKLQQDDPEGTKPILIVDFTSIKSAHTTYTEFVSVYGKDKVIFLPPKPTGILSEEIAYEQMLKDATARLASGQIRAIVSTGSVGTGINIVRPDGSFPDLRVAALGIPQTEQQLVQLIGRRRKKDAGEQNLYYWHFGADEIDKLVSIYEDDPKSGRIYIGRDERSRQMLKAEFEKVKDDPEKLFKYTIDLMRANQTHAWPTDSILIAFDKAVERVMEDSEYELKRMIRERLMGIPLTRETTIGITRDLGADEKQAFIGEEDEDEQTKTGILYSSPNKESEAESDETQIQRKRKVKGQDLLKETDYLQRISVYNNLSDKEQYLLEVYYKYLGAPPFLFEELLREMRNFNPGSSYNFSTNPEKEHFEKWISNLSSTPFLRDRIEDWFESNKEEIKQTVEMAQGEYIREGFDTMGRRYPVYQAQRAYSNFFPVATAITNQDESVIGVWGPWMKPGTNALCVYNGGDNTDWWVLGALTAPHILKPITFDDHHYSIVGMDYAGTDRYRFFIDKYSQ